MTAPGKGGKRPTDLDRLQGDWRVASLEIDGRSMPTAGARITLRGTRFSTVGMGAEYHGTLAIDEAAMPKTFDLRFSSGPEKGNVALGIYELAGDRWKICLTSRHGDRPTLFAATPGTGHALEILERMPARTRRAESAASTAAAGDQEPSGPDTEISGEWSMVSGTLNGEPLDPSHAKWGRRVTRGDVTTVFMGPEVAFKARYRLDPTSEPKAIDYIVLQGPDRGQSQHGIYRLEGTSLLVCMAAAGRERPGEFGSQPGDGRTLTAWRLKSR